MNLPGGNPRVASEPNGSGIPPLISEARTPAISTRKNLRRLFLTLFLRGRSSRGLHKDQAPKSVGTKLAFTLLIYSAFGLMALLFGGQPVFTLSIYLHAMTFVFLGMFIASSAGEVLFNKEEGDILLHRPVTPRALLWAKIGVLVEVSLWLAGAFNLGFAVIANAAGCDRTAHLRHDRVSWRQSGAVFFAYRRSQIRRPRRAHVRVHDSRVCFSGNCDVVLVGRLVLVAGAG